MKLVVKGKGEAAAPAQMFSHNSCTTQKTLPEPGKGSIT